MVEELLDTPRPMKVNTFPGQIYLRILCEVRGESTGALAAMYESLLDTDEVQDD